MPLDLLPALLILPFSTALQSLHQQTTGKFWPDSFVEEMNLSRNIPTCARHWVRPCRTNTTS